MPRAVTVGLDGSPESRAAAEWAACEARMRGLPLRILHVRAPELEPSAQAPPPGRGTHPSRTGRNGTRTPPADGWGRIMRRSAESLRLRHPGVEVISEQVAGSPAETLAEAADTAELLVLGSRGLVEIGGLGGFLAGSTGLSVIAHAARPVVLVRVCEQGAAEPRQPDPAAVPSAAVPFRPVVVGLDLDDPDETPLEFAFDSAARRNAAVRVVHGWSVPPPAGYGVSDGCDALGSLARRRAAELAEVVHPWRQKFPELDVIEASRSGSAAAVLVAASSDACLVIVGQRLRTGPVGGHVGQVTHAVLHHAAAPVAVVPYD